MTKIFDVNFRASRGSRMIYKVKHLEDGKVFEMTLPEILEEINRDRSEAWQDYDQTDWREGLSEWTGLIVIGELVA
jgi:hypothetical protein